ncbi:hypothetical protein CK203_086594 [Vitis vinifera]|uniref:Uncharacterized protein n=1 Tax=Vitis vinifera TaxID=29760 RepID=A0A438FJ95_VITVI|nr:hypothetical protein CK203_086594 [Vitis vinifera]
MVRTKGAPTAPSPRCTPRPTPRQRASSAQVPSDSLSQAAEAPRIPHSEDGAATGPFSPASQCRYETRRPPTTPGATTLHLESSVRRPSTKRARPSSPGESSRASEPPGDSKVLTDLSPESIIRSPMLIAPPIEGNSDCRARLFHYELYFDQEAMREQPELRDSYDLL